jgi:two-component system, OmpR family, sensor histidine kinase KdpD
VRAGQWEARERVVVALTGGPEGETLIRRAGRIAARTKGADLLAVHVSRNEGLSEAGTTDSTANLARQRVLVENLGGTYHQVIGGDIASALIDFARGVNATQLVLGASRRGRFAQMLSPGVGVTATAASGPIDVHMVTHEQVRHRRGAPPRPDSGLSRGRRMAGLATALLGLPLLTVLLVQVREDISLSTEILTFLLTVVSVALIGGLFPAVLAAVLGFLLLNFYFAPPLHRFTVDERENLFAMGAFVLVAVAVSTVVDLAARRTREASRARAEAATLFTLSGSVLRGNRPMPALLAQLRESFGLDGVSLLEQRDGTWFVVEKVGDVNPGDDAGDRSEIKVDDQVSLVLHGRPLAAGDWRVIEAFGAQAAVALRQEQLAEQASAVGPLSEIDRLRTALLSAVGHDLRTPLASARAAVSSLRSSDVAFTETDRSELLATADESLERLGALVENLLDMSRLQAGALALSLEPASVAEVVPAAVDELGEAGAHVRIAVPDDLSDVLADPVLLQRAVVNLLANALRYSPAGEPPLISASEHEGAVEIRIIDRGPGVAQDDRDRIFLPFQRLGDRDNVTGVGLGLALSRGLVEAMGGTVVPETTPGGGLTMIVALPALPPPSPASSPLSEQP